MKRNRSLMICSSIPRHVLCPANLFSSLQAGGASTSEAAAKSQTRVSDLSSPLQATNEGGGTASQLNQLDQVGEDIHE